MRPPHALVHSRARVRQRYALFPLEGFPPSRLPAWPDTEARVLASPALGAQFTQYLLDIPAGKGRPRHEAQEQQFGYVLSGQVRVTIAGKEQTLDAGGYFYIPFRQ